MDADVSLSDDKDGVSGTLRAGVDGFVCVIGFGLSSFKSLDPMATRVQNKLRKSAILNTGYEIIVIILIARYKAINRLSFNT